MNQFQPLLVRLHDHIRSYLNENASFCPVILTDLEVDFDNSFVRNTLIPAMRWFQIKYGINPGFLASGRNTSDGKILKSLEKHSGPFRLQIDKNLIINRDTLSSSPEDYLRNQGYQAIVWIGEGGPVEDEHQLIITPEEISRAAGGNYGLSQIITEQDLPDSILYCWHGINDYENLRRFLDSSVQWGEVDVRVDPESGELISRHDSLARSPRFSNEEFLTLRESLVRFKKNDRGVKVDLKMGGAVVAETLKLLKSLGFSAEEVWFHADIQVIGIRGFNSLVTTYPYAMVQTTIDPLAPFIAGVPPFGKWMLRFARHWGVNRFLQTWKSRYRVRVLERMERWGLPVNLYQIPDLEEFLKAVLLLPSSITTDFNFPEWGYYGRGSGQNLQWHEYPDHC